MTSNLLNKDMQMTLKKFIADIKQGKRNLFEILDLREESFDEASFETIMANEEDVLSGVNRVLIRANYHCFDVFTECVIKYHDDGEVKFIFSTITENAKLITTVADTFIDSFDQEYFDRLKQLEFKDAEKIETLSRGIITDRRENKLHASSKDEVCWQLEYAAAPFNKLSLITRILPSKKIDYSIRRKGTILDIMEFDIYALFGQDALSEVAYGEEDDPDHVQYLFTLKTPVLGVFDRVWVVKYGPEKAFNPDIHTVVTFVSFDKIPFEKKLHVMEKLINLYGPDMGGNEELQLYERHLLEKVGNFSGRYWQFNQWNGLWQKNNPNELYSYDVLVDDYKDGRAFKLSIWGYDQLISLFSTE